MKRFLLKRFLLNKRALGAPVGNLIILIAAVVLASTVVVFAITVTSNQVQKENLYVAGASVDAEKAVITIENTGPTSIRITQVTIKGDRFSSYTSSPDIGGGLPKGTSTTITQLLTPDLITVNDIGRPMTVIVSTTQGVYFTETIIRAADSSGSS